MIAHVPILEFIHELRSAGIPVDYWDVVDHPDRYWKELADDRRERVLARLNVHSEGASVADVRVLCRRGRVPTQDHVFVRLALEAKPDIRARLHRAREYLLFKPLDVPELEDDEVEEFRVPQVMFREGSFKPTRRSMLQLLDDAWGREPYDASSEGSFCHFHPIEGFRELERYWVEDPFALIVVLRDDEGQLVYHIEEPRLSELEKSLLVTMNDRLRDVLLLEDEQTHRERSDVLLSKVFEILRVYRYRVDRRTAYKLGYYFLRNYLGFGRLEPIMRDTHIEDVSCNGPELPVYVDHSRYKSLRTNLVFDELELNSFTIKMAQRGGKLLSVAQPLTDATLPDGSRIQASLGREVTSRGSAFTIRKFREDPLTCVDLIRGRTHSLDTMAFLWLAVEMKASLVVMGATASGKTTTLNSLSQFIPPTRKIVTIEDTREIMLQHENWLAGVTRDSVSGAENEAITMYDLLRAALRQRPEYIIVGEIRGAEGLTLFQAMSTGHTCYSTMHAGSVENAVHRLENPPISVPRVMLTSLDFFLVQGQADLDGRPVRRMLSLTEVNGMDSSSRNLRMNEVYRWESTEDDFQHASSSYVLDRMRAERGWTRSRLAEEVAARRDVLQRLVESKQRHYLEVAKGIRQFYNRREIEEDDVLKQKAPVVRVASGEGKGSS